MTADPPGRDAVSVGTFPVSSQVQAAPLQRLADLLLRFGFLKRLATR
jgi:hypothetical protein